jgi:hypothetical protein
MTHWDVARGTFIGLALGLSAIAGYIGGGLFW